MSRFDTSYEDLRKELEANVRLGRNSLVLDHLKQMRWADVPRLFLADFAEIARRINQPLISLRIINPVIRSKFLLSEPPTNREMMVYATSLSTLGFLDEAMEILGQIDARLEPDALLYRAFAAFGKWNYRSSYPWLKSYVQSSKVSDYFRVVGQVNLLAAYIAEFDLKPASALADHLLSVTRGREMNLLYGNSLELSSQLALLKGDYSQALEFLKEAKVVLAQAKGIYLDFVKKWELICRLLMQPTSHEAKTALLEFRQESLGKRHWEIVRDCDLHLALATADQEGLTRVLRGTPFRSYHRRAERLWRADLKTTNSYILVLGEPKQNLDARHPDFDAQPTLALLLWSLTQDFFKPVSMGALFNSLYPNQYFDPRTSTKRVHNVVYRFRCWLQEKKWPLEVEVNRYEFFLKGNAALKVFRTFHGPKGNRFQRFHRIWGPREFQTNDVARVLGISRRSAQILIQEQLRKKCLLLLGHGNSRRYRAWNRRAA